MMVRMKTLNLLAGVIASLAIPSLALADDATNNPPPSYHVEHVRPRAVVGGASLFGTAYGISLTIAALNAPNSSHDPWMTNAMFVPVVGPFISMGSSLSNIAGNCGMWCGLGVGAEALLAVNGLAQAGGLALMIYGLAHPATVVPDHPAQSHKVKLMPTPIAGRGFAGAGLGFRY
jgi:hypothetical protein